MPGGRGMITWVVLGIPEVGLNIVDVLSATVTRTQITEETTKRYQLKVRGKGRIMAEAKCYRYRSSVLFEIKGIHTCKAKVQLGPILPEG
jgi:hypothetical protein